MPSRDFPSEIYLKIFNLLEKKDLFTCIHVCKKWLSLATQNYYEQLMLMPNNIRRLRRHMIDFKQQQQKEQQQDSFYRNLLWVKRLMIDDRDEATTSKLTVTADNDDYLISKKFEKEEFLSMILALTNITVLDISCSVYYEDYMTNLRDSNLEGCMQHIEEIPKRSYYSRDELYFEVCFKFRKSLTHLSLSAFDHTYTTATTTATKEQQLTGDWIYFLPYFKNITHLSIYKIRENYLLFRFLELCPKLISVKFLNNILMFEDDEDRGAPITATPYSSYSKQLKTLKMWLPLLKDPYLTYVQHYPPNHLDTLHIDMNNIDFNKWITGVSIDILSSLGRSLSTIRNLTIRVKHNNGLSAFHDSDDDELAFQMASTTTGAHHSKVTRFYAFVGAIKGSRDLLCEAVYRQSDTSETLIRVESNERMFMKYRIDYQDYNILNTRRSSIFSLPLFRSSLPLPNYLYAPIGLQMLNRLTFALGGHVSIPGKVLQHALKNCPYLELLEITMWQGGNESIMSQFKACRSFSTDNFGDDNKGPMSISVGEEEKENTNRGCEINTTSENLTKLFLKGSSLSAKVVNLVSSYLPNLDTLFYEHPSKFEEYNTSRRRRNIDNYSDDEEGDYTEVDEVVESIDSEEEEEEETSDNEISQDEDGSEEEEEEEETDSDSDSESDRDVINLVERLAMKRKYQIHHKNLHLEKFENLKKFSARIHTAGLEFIGIISTNSNYSSNNSTHYYSVKKIASGPDSKETYTLSQTDYDSVDVYAEVLGKYITIPTFIFCGVLDKFTLYNGKYNLIATFHHGVLVTN